MGTIPSQPATTGSEQPHRVLDPKAKARLQRAVKEFESVMVGYMLKSMRASVPKEDGFGESLGGDMLEGMFDSELAKYVSRGSNLGLGEMLYKEITGEEMPRVNPGGTEGPGYRGASVRKVAASSAASGAQPDTPASATQAAVPGPQTVSPLVTAPVAPPAAPATIRPQARAAKTPTAPESAPAVVKTTPPSVANITAPSDTVRRRLEALDPIIRTAADTTGVNASLLKAVIATESGGRAQAQSARNAKGLMQLIDSTASAMGVRNVWDPLQNVQGGARYLGQMMNRFGGNIEHALASYNAGPGAVEKHNGVPPYRETQQYVGKVMEYLRYFEQQETGNDDQD